MGLMAKKSGDGTDYEPIPEGTHHAVCYSIIDLGTQHSQKFDNEAYKVCVTWEIPKERIEIDGKDLPRAISRIYTLSLHEKSNLFKDLTAWRGKHFTDDELDGFDIFNVLGANCLLQTCHTVKDSKTYSNIVSVAKLMVGMPKLEPENPTVTYSIMENGIEIPESVPDWLKLIIRKSSEYQMVFKNKDNPAFQEPAEVEQPDDLDPGESDEIPF